VGNADGIAGARTGAVMPHDASMSSGALHRWIGAHPDPTTPEVVMPRIIPNLWFDTQALEAAELYVSIFPNSRITDVTHYGDSGPMPAGTVLTVEFELDGQPHTALNGGPVFEFTEAVSLLVECADQAEVDHYWDKLLDGGQPSQCGWLKDRYGLSWQVVPAGMVEMLNDPDRQRAERAMAAMMGMVKLDLDSLRAAADGIAPTSV
jgi:predicted 3-demethylubiquinone-9 3-methyltransferase (glyoxalase superfamily)